MISRTDPHDPKNMWWMLFHIYLLGVLIAVHIDVDDVLALAEAGAVEGELTSAGWTGQMFFQIFRHVTIVVPRVLHGAA